MTAQTFTLPTAFAAYDDEAMVWVVFAKPLWTGGIHRAVAKHENERDAVDCAELLAKDPAARQAALDA